MPQLVTQRIQPPVIVACAQLVPGVQVGDVGELGMLQPALDAMIAVGGLTRYAAGNDTVLIRTAQGEQNTYSVHLSSLIRDGDIDSNVALRPGDILIIPQRLF